MKKETALLLTLLSSYASGGDNLTDKLIGEWCLNTEEYAGEISVDGSRWTFKADGTYVTKQAYVSEDKYRVDGDTIELDNFGKMKVLRVNDKEMTGRVYSTYHFTRDECLPLVKEAEQITRLNNAIIKKDMELVKRLVESGVDISKPDTRSSMASTPLIVAIQYGGKEFVEYILSLDPDLSVTDGLGRTALEVAQKTKNAEIIDLVEKANQ